MKDVFSDEILGDPEKAGCLATVGGMRIRLKADYKTNKSAFQGILEAALAPWGSEKEFDGRYGFEGTTDFGDGLVLKGLAFFYAAIFFLKKTDAFDKY